MDYRDVPEGDFDAISSIGLTEHIGVRNYPAYFAFLQVQAAPGGRLLNHCITRPDNLHDGITRGGFIDRYVFPDGELAGSGRIIPVDAGRRASRSGTRRTCASTTRMTLRDWCATCATTGTRPSPRSARAPPGCGASTWPARGCPSSATGSSCTRCSASTRRSSGDAAFPLRPDWGSL